MSKFKAQMKLKSPLIKVIKGKKFLISSYFDIDLALEISHLDLINSIPPRLQKGCTGNKRGPLWERL